MSDSITLCIVKDGAAGTSINMKTGVSSPDALPSSGASVGDSYIIDGHLWTYTGGTASDATHRNGFTDCGKVSGEAGKNNYVHVAWSNKQNPTKDDIVLSNTDGNAYAYMGTWVSETKEDTADEAVNMAKWVYVKGDKGDTPTFAKLRVNHSALHYNPSTGKWDYDSVTVTIVIFTSKGTQIPDYGDTKEYYWLLDDDTTVKRSSGMGFSATLNAASHRATLYKDGSNVAIDTITVPMVRDGKQGTDGSAATVYTIEAVGNYNNNSGKLVDASTIGVTLTGDLKLYKTVGNEKTEDSKPPQCWRLTVGGENVDGTRVFDNNAGNNIVTYEYYNEYNIDSNGNSTAPGSATISVYRDSSMSELLASLVVPISLNPGAIVNVDAKLGKIESTTTSMQGTIETIKQGQGQISLKVQGLERKSRNILSGGNVIGLFNKQYEVFRSLPFVMEKGRTYTVTARLWMESNSNERHVKAFVFGSDNNWTYAYSSAYFTKTSADYLRFKFEAGVTRQMVVAFYEQNSSGDNPGSGNYNGVHVDWVRVDEGDWTGVDANGRTLDKWEPSEEETNAVNLLPNPAFSASIGYTDGMGERNTFVGSMGDAVPWMSRDSSADGDGCRGVTFERSGYSDPNGTNPNSYGGLRYIVPFRGAGTYCISFVYTDLSQTLSGKPDMDEVVVMELHPCDADKYRITAGIYTGGRNTSSANSGIIRAQTYKTFGETATDNSGKVKKIAYLEVRVFLRGNGSVRVSRLCLSKSDHFIYWNANDVSEARKKEAALFATGIDIDSKKITLTASNTTFRDNDGKEMAVIDHDGLRATKIATTDNGGGHTEISGNTTVWYNKDGVTPGIKVFYDAAGVPHFQFCNSNGKVMYDFGPSGLQSFISSTQQAYSDECYLRSVSGGFKWVYVPKNVDADKRFVWRKQIPTTEASSHYEIYDGCVFTKEYYNTANSVNWPKPAFLLPDGWYVEPNDGNLPIKKRPADEEGVFDPTKTVYYQTFCYYSGGKVSRTVRAYMTRNSNTSDPYNRFSYNGSYDEML